MKRSIMKVAATAVLSLITFWTLCAEVPLTPDGTYMYARKDTCDLFMNVYEPSAQTMSGCNKSMTVVFMPEGLISPAHMDAQNYLNWFRLMTQKGYRVISIDYSCSLEEKNIQQKRLLEKAVRVAIDDLIGATAFIIDNADQLGVDPSGIIICGSSIGAAAVLEAEYELCNRASTVKLLPDDFRYAGIISFSGAVISKKGKIRYKSSPSPTLMFHGTKDTVIPYKSSHGLVGSGTLAKLYGREGFRYKIYNFDGMGHEVADYIEKTADLQFKFLEDCVADGKCQ